MEDSKSGNEQNEEIGDGPLGACRYVDGGLTFCFVSTQAYCYGQYWGHSPSWSPNVDCDGAPLPKTNM